MTYLTPLQGEILAAIATIAFGVFVEKWFVSRSSIMMNVMNWFILLFTIDVQIWVIQLMAVWVAIGFGLTYVHGYGGIKQLFGSKVFGSFSLVLGLITYGSIHIRGRWLLIAWVGLSVIVFLLGRKYANDNE